MLTITQNLEIPDKEIEISAIHAQGSGGQNVNKVATAVHLRFDIPASSLPEEHKQRLLAFNDQRINKEGVIIIKAQSFRSQEQNREDALQRLAELVKNATFKPKKRRKTKPTKSSQRKRLDNKTRKGRKKQLRKKVTDD